MKKFILLLTALAFIVGCEDDDNNTSSNDYTLLNKVGVVQYVNEGSSRTFVTLGGNELNLDSANVYVLRDSGSGFSSGNLTAIGPGDTLDYYFYHELADYRANPNQIPVIKVYVYGAGNPSGVTPPTADD